MIAKMIKSDDNAKTLGMQHDTHSNTPILYLVLPAFNEEEVIEKTLDVLSNKLCALIAESIIATQSSIVIIDDGSRDRTWDIIKNKAKINVQPLQSISNYDIQLNNSSINSTKTNIQSPHIIALKLSRNFGHQNALLAGLHYATNKCDCSISMDCDLQQDEEKIFEFIDKFNHGSDIVMGVRNDRQGDSGFKKYSALGFYWLMQSLGVKIVKNHADFRLLSNKALQHLASYTEFHFFLRALVLDMGLKQDVVYFDVKPRFAGSSKYSLSKMLAFAWNGITSFSIKPLRIVSALGAMIFLLSIFFGLYALYVKFFTNNAIYGWASTLILLCFFNGLQLLSLGIIGEYIGKMYQEVKARPKYCIDEILDSKRIE